MSARCAGYCGINPIVDRRRWCCSLPSPAACFRLFAGVPFLTGLWLPANLFGTPGIFDIGVYLVVFGTITAVVLALEDSGEAV